MSSNMNVIKPNKRTNRYTITKYRNGKLKDSIELYVGGKYQVIPDNPLKLKHRNRICYIVEFKYDNLKNPIKAKVKFDKCAVAHSCL